VGFGVFVLDHQDITVDENHIERNGFFGFAACDFGGRPSRDDQFDARGRAPGFAFQERKGGFADKNTGDQANDQEKQYAQDDLTSFHSFALKTGRAFVRDTPGIVLDEQGGRVGCCAGLDMPLSGLLDQRNTRIEI
jgi:hypothetical protein